MILSNDPLVLQHDKSLETLSNEHHAAKCRPLLRGLGYGMVWYGMVYGMPYGTE